MPVGAVIAAVGVAAGVAGQVASANAQDKQAKASGKAAQDNANGQSANYREQIKMMKLRMNQDNMEALDEKMKRKMSADQLTAHLRVAAGESGVSGSSVQRVMNHPQAIAGTDMATIDASLKNKMDQYRQEMKAMKVQTENGMAAQQASVLPGANWAAVGLQIVGQAASSAGSLVSATPKSTPSKYDQ